MNRLLYTRKRRFGILFNPRADARGNSEVDYKNMAKAQPESEGARLEIDLLERLQSLENEINELESKDANIESARGLSEEEKRELGKKHVLYESLGGWERMQALLKKD